MRILGIDHGSRRVGVAISDALGISAHGLCVLEGADVKVLVDQIRELVHEREVDRIVVGLPLNMDGSEGPQARVVRTFVERLEQHLGGVPVETLDERLTSQQADRILDEMGVRGKRRRERRDRLAAQILLQGWLERRLSDAT